MIKFARYDEQDVLALIRLLRLAVILNKSRQAAEKIQNLSLKNDRIGGAWILAFEPGYLERNPLVSNELRQESNGLKELALELLFN